jgi:hypothetical protein
MFLDVFYHSLYSEVSMDDTSIYFGHYSRNLLIEALRVILQRSLETEEQPDLRPYKLLMTLLDKPEVGVEILEDIIIDVFRALYHSNVSSGRGESSQKTTRDLGKKSEVAKANIIKVK